MKFAESHEWVKTEDEIAVIGITAHAQRELGEIVYVELPQIGRNIKAGEIVAILESTKAAADIYAPISGEVTEVNPALKQDISLLNERSETEGWLFKVKLADPRELDTLLDHEHYHQMIS